MSNKRKVSEMALAVKAVREASRISQEAFAQQIGTTATSISRIERGLQTPASFDTLNRLEKVARDLGLAQEAGLFDEARSALRFTAYRPPEHHGDADPTYPLPQWRLGLAARLAAAYFPERLPAIEEALRPAVEIVDEVLRSTNESEIDYAQMEREAFSRAKRRMVRDLKCEASTPAMKEK
jgi:transcriptional regulator with XRE-family HTH domain